MLVVGFMFAVIESRLVEAVQSFPCVCAYTAQEPISTSR